MTLERTPIFVLFRVGRPFAIVGRIASLVIDAFKCKAGWLLAHVREKVFKAVQPAIAHCDAAGGVVKEILLAVRVVAARFHVRPRAKCGTPATGCVAMGNALLTRQFIPEASTRSCVAIPQIGGSNCYFGATDTATSPVHENGAWRTSVSMRNAKNSQPTELLTRYILQFGHRTGSTVRGQVAARPCKVWPLRLA
jgi:hypothetical protein